MRIVFWLLSLSLCFGFVYLLNHSLSLKTKSLPPPGPFFSPFHGFWQNADPILGAKDLSISSEFLQGPVSVHFDSRGVPHIFADYLEDALFVQGFVTARDRLWQMDISTRASSGRLAEILGPDLVDRDKLQRRKGLMRAAEKTAASWQKSKADLALIEAYVAGVNHYIQHLSPKDFPLEFKLLDYEPEPWSVLKAAQFYKSMEEVLNSKEFDLPSTNTLQLLGENRFLDLFPDWNPQQSPVIPTRQYAFKGMEETKKTSLPLYGQGPVPVPFQHDPAYDFIGSNNWAVAGSKTKNGYPILCNDPHLNLTLPSFWYEIQIHTPEFNTYGVSFPGIPGIIIGFNNHCAWGITNGSHDVKDWYQIHWQDEQREKYVVDGVVQSVEKHLEIIQVKNAPPVTDTVKYTVWGPVVFEDTMDGHYNLAMHWIANDTLDDFVWKTFWTFDQAKHYQDFLKATEAFGHPIQNFVFASKSGDIALKTSGFLPLKDSLQGRFLLDGSNSANAWKGFVPNEQLPQIFNPQRGFVSSANQHSTYPTYPYYYNGYFNDYRGRLINKLLEEKSDWTTADMQALQNNNYSLLAAEALPLLLQHLDTTSLSGNSLSILQELKNWNYQFNAGEKAPAFFQSCWSAFNTALWDEFESSAKGPFLIPDDWRTIRLIQFDSRSSYFDIQQTPKKETLEDLVLSSLEHAAAKLETQRKVPGFNWASFKATRIDHLGKIPAFSRKNIEVGGFEEAINAVKETTGPSWRMIVELGDTIQAFGIYPGGQSGNPGSPFYDNFIEDWRKGNYYPLWYMQGPSDFSEHMQYQVSFQPNH